MDGSATSTTEVWAALRRRLAGDTTGGVLLLIGTAIALIWANSPWSAAYETLIDTEIGPASLHLHLSVGEWAADGLLAVFFFVVGVELKHEFVDGSLRQPKLAGVPVAAAVGGMIVPALVYVAVLAVAGAADDETLRGWAVPIATDIAFALAVLAIFGRGLPSAIRMFLLTLAVVDDLLGILVIATVYTSEIDVAMLAASSAVIVVFAVVVRARRLRWWVLIPLGVVAWSLMHASGVHATIAGVLLGATVPARACHGESSPRTHRLDQAVWPYSAGLALPLFAFASAGVAIGGGGSPLFEPVSAAIIAALVFGKIAGVLGTTVLVTRLTPLRLPESIGVRDLVPVGMLTGIGFTVSLLIAELSFGDGPHADPAKVAVLTGSLITAVAAAVLLRWNRRIARPSTMASGDREHL